MLIGNFYFDQYVNKVNAYIFIIPHHLFPDEFNYKNMDNEENLLRFCLDKNVLSYNFNYILLDKYPSFSLKDALNATNHIFIPV